MGVEIEVFSFVDFLINYNNIDKVKLCFLAVRCIMFFYGKGITIYMCVGYVGAFHRALIYSVKYTLKCADHALDVSPSTVCC